MSYMPADVGVRTGLFVASISKEAAPVPTFSALTSAVAVTDLAYITRLYLPTPTVVRRFYWANGTTASTNTVQVGLYSDALTSFLLGTATVAAGVSALQFDDVADTAINAGWYWLACVVNGATTHLMRRTNAFNRAAGQYQMAAARPLPATLVPAAKTESGMPVFGFTSIA